MIITIINHWLSLGHRPAVINLVPRRHIRGNEENKYKAMQERGEEEKAQWPTEISLIDAFQKGRESPGTLGSIYSLCERKLLQSHVSYYFNRLNCVLSSGRVHSKFSEQGKIICFGRRNFLWNVIKSVTIQSAGFCSSVKVSTKVGTAFTKRSVLQSTLNSLMLSAEQWQWL